MAQPPQVSYRRGRLGGVLGRLRDQAGMTQGEVAAQLSITDDRISRVENGKGKLDIPLLRALLGVYGIDDPEMVSALEDMVRNVVSRGWWYSYNSYLHTAYQDFLGLEGDADEVKTWQTLLIPGRLQTEEYARALLVAGQGIVHSSPEQVAKLVAVRMQRQGHPWPRQFSVILSEAALRGSIGTEITRRQIEHLIITSETPAVDLRVMPLSVGPHVGLDGPFSLFRFPDGGRLAHLESLVSSFYLEDSGSVAAYARGFEQLMSIALDQDDSRAHLEHLARSL